MKKAKGWSARNRGFGFSYIERWVITRSAPRCAPSDHQADRKRQYVVTPCKLGGGGNRRRRDGLGGWWFISRKGATKQEVGPAAAQRSSFTSAFPSPVRYAAPSSPLRMTPVTKPGSGSDIAGVSRSSRGFISTPRRTNSAAVASCSAV